MLRRGNYWRFTWNTRKFLAFTNIPKLSSFEVYCCGVTTLLSILYSVPLPTILVRRNTMKWFTSYTALDNNNKKPFKLKFTRNPTKLFTYSRKTSEKFRAQISLRDNQELKPHKSFCFRYVLLSQCKWFKLNFVRNPK